VKPTS